MSLPQAAPRRVRRTDPPGQALSAAGHSTPSCTACVSTYSPPCARFPVRSSYPACSRPLFSPNSDRYLQELECFSRFFGCLSRDVRGVWEEMRDLVAQLVCLEREEGGGSVACQSPRPRAPTETASTPERRGQWVWDKHAGLAPTNIRFLQLDPWESSREKPRTGARNGG